MNDLQTGEVFAIDLWKILFMLINLLLIYLTFKKFLYGPVKKIFEMREKEVTETYDKAATAEKEANELKDKYEKKLLSAKEEAQEIVSSATKRAQLRSESIVNDAKETVSNMMSRAQEQIESEKKKAVNEIKDGITDIALMAASTVLEKDMNTADHNKLIDEFIDKMGEEPWQN